MLIIFFFLKIKFLAGVQRYCTLCEETGNENFTEILKQKTCKWYNNQTCSHCPSGTICYEFLGMEQNLCYIPELGISVEHVDFTNIVLYPIFLKYVLYISAFFSIILFITTFIFIFLPHLIQPIIKWDKSESKL